jgi:hypothetical protein
VKGLSIWEQVHWAGLIEHPFKAEILDPLDDDLLQALNFGCTSSEGEMIALREKTDWLINS